MASSTLADIRKEELAFSFSIGFSLKIYPVTQTLLLQTVWKRVFGISAEQDDFCFFLLPLGPQMQQEGPSAEDLEPLCRKFKSMCK